MAQGTTQGTRMGGFRRRIGVTLSVAALLTPLVVVATAAPASAAITANVSDNTLIVGETTTVTVDGSGGYGGAVFLVITSCGNADPFGQPLVAAGPSDCHGIEALASGGIEFVLSPVDGTNYPVGYTWPDSFGTNNATCIAGGNFPCVIQVLALDGAQNVLETISIPINATPPPTLVPGSTTVTEGDTGLTLATIDFTINAPAPGSSFDWEAVSFSATEGADFAPASGSVIFSGTDTTEQVVVPVFGDESDEIDELFVVRVTAVNGLQVGGFYGLGVVAITDDDDPPSATVAKTAIGEGNAGSQIAQLAVTLSEVSGKTVTVDWATAGYGATDLVDFIASSGTIEFPPGEQQVNISIEVLGDETIEAIEAVIVGTNNHVNATVGPNGAFGALFIIDDDDCGPPFAPGMDLRGCDLSGQLIANVDLSGSDLSGANLSGAQLINVDLSGATLDETVLDGAIIANSNLDNLDAQWVSLLGTTIINTSLENASLRTDATTGASFVGVSVTGTNFHASRIWDAVFLVDNAREAMLADVYWAGNTVCPDGTLSGQHASTCYEVDVDLRAGGTTLNDDPVDLSDTYFFATFHEGPQFDPSMLFAGFFEGPIGSNESQFFDVEFFFDSDGDGNPDQTYGFLVDDAALLVGTHTYCVTGALYNYNPAYGCDELEVTDNPDDDNPISPPASPPSSPTASPPISAGPLAGLAPLLAGPVGLMATAGGLGAIFLFGARRTAVTLEGNTREDDEFDEDDNNA